MAGNENILQLTAQVGSADTTSIFYAVGSAGTVDTQISLGVLYNNPNFTGIPTTPTAAVNTNTTQIASTAYVVNQGYLTSTTAASTYAPKNNPVFSGSISGGSASISLGGAASFASIQSTPIGTTAAAAGGFTTLTNSGAFTVNGNISGPGITTLLNPYAPLASPSFTGIASAATLLLSNHLTPSTTFGIVGTQGADNANAGSIGEYVTATASSISLSSGVTANITSISLTAGDWDVTGVVSITPTGTTTLANSFGGTSTTTATLGTLGSYWQDAPGGTAPAGSAFCYALPTMRYNVSTTTTVFCVAQASFSVSTCTASGVIRARRVR